MDPKIDDSGGYPKLKVTFVMFRFRTHTRFFCISLVTKVLRIVQMIDITFVKASRSYTDVRRTRLLLKLLILVDKKATITPKSLREALAAACKSGHCIVIRDDVGFCAKGQSGQRWWCKYEIDGHIWTFVVFTEGRSSHQQLLAIINIQFSKKQHYSMRS